MYKYNKIGSCFKEGKYTLMVVESLNGEPSCFGCWYGKHKKGTKIRNYPYGCHTHKHLCTPFLRKDRKHVIFKEISEE